MSFDRPQPWEFVHTVAGVELRGEVLIIGQFHFMARIRLPFRATFKRSVNPGELAGMAGFSFLCEGRATAQMMGELHSGVEQAYDNWKVREIARERLVANLDDLKPAIEEAHRKATALWADIETLGARLQFTAEALKVELREERRRLKHRLQNGECERKDFVIRDERIREKGPSTGQGLFLLIEAKILQGHMSALCELLDDVRKPLSRQTGLMFCDVCRAANLQAPPYDQDLASDPTLWLSNITIGVRQMMRATP